MKVRIASAALMILVLGACQPDGPAEATDASNASGAAVAPPPAPPGLPPANAEGVAPETMPGDGGPATFLGYGDMRLGSSAAEARQAWGGELDGHPTEPQGCHYLTPKWVANSSEMAFMIEGGRFVRYDVGTAKVPAPGGGKVGMTAQELAALYGAMDSLPHKYVEGGRYLSRAASGVAPTRLVFETDATGTVTSWRVGMEPQVDYVEGCS